MASDHGLYTWLFDDLADSRVKNWPFMNGPLTVILILLTYLSLVKFYLPEWMKSRSAFNLKTILNVYNLFQVTSNAVIFHGLLTSGWTTTYHLGCQMPDYSNNPEGVRMAGWMWWATMLRLVELVETVFFILRKKNNQASFLHVYHHVINITIMWIATKYAPGGMTSMTPMINSLVHVLMYAYYFLSANAGPRMKTKLNKWKMWLTVVQMIQFTILLIHILQALAPSCPAPRILVWIYLPNLLMVYYLFIVFFKNSYSKRSKKQSGEKRA